MRCDSAESATTSDAAESAFGLFRRPLPTTNQGPDAPRPRPRAPYFHNGFAADLDAVVDFYDTRFGIGFTKQEKSDLITFLRSL